MGVINVERKNIAPVNMLNDIDDLADSLPVI